jgi:hypothetical protein
MKVKSWCSRAAWTAVVAAAALGLGPTHAHAQFGFGGGGFGGGLGWGFGMFRPVPSPTGYLYQKSISDSQRDMHIASRDVYANNPNSYINHVRDNGFVDRYAVERREAARYRRAARQAGAALTTQTSTPAAAQVPTLPLSSFYNQQNELVWPGDAPTAGDLKEKRSMFDQASQEVLAETKKNGVASMAAVTSARTKLLEYGRPGLQYVREHDTPRIADSYHLFLLSLYESLAQAVNPPADAASAGRTTPNS